MREIRVIKDLCTALREIQEDRRRNDDVHKKIIVIIVIATESLVY
jgi:hypothetical protein